MVGTEMVDVDWRAVAEERQREIERLRAQLLAAIDAIPDANVRAFITALDAEQPAWLRELDVMRASSALESAEVTSVIEDLWRRVSAE
ncbi:MAG TPA: hypothetical protein VMU84_15655 [Thermoanaerobaculia bacterium]|nr:hypothetical protein [Thermoanaerobaculia bacterium]